MRDDTIFEYVMHERKKLQNVFIIIDDDKEVVFLHIFQLLANVCQSIKISICFYNSKPARPLKMIHKKAQ